MAVQFLSDFGILLAKKITTVFGRCRILKPTSSLSASPLSALPASRTSKQRCRSVSLVYALAHLITLQWYPEISHHAPQTSMVLVGTKLDLREDAGTVEKLRDRYVLPKSRT